MEEQPLLDQFTGLLKSLFNMTFGSPEYYYYWWLGLLGILLVFFIVWRFRAARRNFRVFRDESGVAETTNSALRDLVHIACDGVETASKPRIKFKKKHGRIDVQIRAKLYQGQKLGEIRDQMRKRVQKIFQDTHGILVGDVSFTATGFKKGKNGFDSLDPEPVKPVVVKEPEPVKKVEPKPEPKKEPEPVAKEDTGMKSYRREEPKSAEAAPKEEPEEEPKKKGGLFGGFGGKKKEDLKPVITEPKKDADESLDDDDEFSKLLAENDEKDKK